MGDVKIVREGEECCGNCYFWRKRDDTTMCCRFPPRPVPQVRDRFLTAELSVFPAIGADGWCGEWKP